ncbi:MAG: FAD:protein FMN transferase [Calditrichaeota bacterium]|nr:FAD:protein FMN transferase [Calditrichota bacterium]MCB9369634.1 FAD:protein FMN transferase [Calditrichota bacterium]
MASPCEILTEAKSHRDAAKLLEIASLEAWRIEDKFSRYLAGNIIHQINTAGGSSVQVDEETARLLSYAAECFAISDGMFDITSGVLRKVWKFDGSDKIPSEESVKEILPRVGWEKITFEDQTLTMPAGMEIDLGGIGKEYAVDLVAGLIAYSSDASFVVNFGGDLFVSGLRSSGEPWQIGLDDPQKTGEGSVGMLKIERGGVATSGDARRFLLRDGVRYSHILNPKTGWPIQDAPRSIMVVADSCVEAGVLSTVAMLNGQNAESFLEQEGVVFWCQRGKDEG